MVQSEDLKINKSNMNFLQNFATLPTRLIETEGKWAKIQKLLKGFFPVIGNKSWTFSNIKKQDWIILQSEQLSGLVKIDNVAVPKFRNLPDKYRYTGMEIVSNY